MDKLIEQFSLGLFFWMLILFVILVFFLNKFAWKPILNSVNEREDGIKNALEEAENARKEMQNLNADNERILKEARAQRDTLLKEAREMKEGIISEAKNEAQAQATKIVAQAQETIQAEKQAAITDLKNQVAELSVGIAEKVVRGELADKNKQIKLVEELLKEVTIS
ncbi:F0F1 ATP synthase subunit B [Lutibacter sp.]|jgi:F-type H+-transporting ATPase subunit b|uniref:F0F1 ATP synthase subunit B n=1 Tax=Lutibacter sp. TaxID=1925666 RepID=UPI0034A0182F